MNIKKKKEEVTQIQKGEVGERMPDPGARGRIRRSLGRLARLDNSFIAAAFGGVTCSRADSACRSPLGRTGTLHFLPVRFIEEGSSVYSGGKVVPGRLIFKI